MDATDRRDRGWGDDADLVAASDVPPGRVRRLLPATVLVVAVLSCLLGLWLLVWPPSSRDGSGLSSQATSGRSLPAPPNPAPPRAPTSDHPPAPSPDQLVLEARRVAKQVQRDLPDHPAALLLAGRIYYAFNDTSQAQACWEACLQKSPEFSAAHCAIGEAAWEHGEFQRAADHLRRALARDSDVDPKTVYFLADALMSLGQAQDALAVLQRSAQAQALPPFGLFLLGHAYQEVGEYERAAEQFRAVLAADPKSANAHFGLASVCARLGHTEEAREHRETYARLRQAELSDSARLRPDMRQRDWADTIPVVREAYLNAGKIYIASGRLAEAQEQWRRAAVLDPQDPRPKQLLQSLDQGPRGNRRQP